MNRLFILLLLMLTLPSHLPADAQSSFRYGTLPELPSIDGKPNPGVAGAFAGISHGALLLAGGANFPNGYPWQNGRKAWQSAVYVLSEPGKSTHWQSAGTLPGPLAYGASVSWNEQLICIGGANADQQHAAVFSLTWHPKTRQVITKTLPDLPLALANLSASVLGHELYVFGGESSQGSVRSLFVLNLQHPESSWQSRADLPGQARSFTTLVAMPDADGGSLFVLGGRQTVAGQTTVFGDAYQYHPKQNTWQRLGNLPVAVAAHEAAGVDTNRLLLFGGDDGVRLRQIEALNNQITNQPDHPEKAKWVVQRNDLQMNHPGFRREIWQYRTDTKRWAVVGHMPFPAPVTTTAIRWGKSFLLPSGEVSPGIRTPTIRLITSVSP